MSGIKRISINNYKCFDDLNIEDFKQVNLIGGKNSVGKTALLEAIELSVSGISPRGLLETAFLMLNRRQSVSYSHLLNLDFFKSQKKKIRLSSNINEISISLSQQNDSVSFLESDSANGEITAKINDKELSIPIDKFCIKRDPSNLVINRPQVNYMSSEKVSEKNLAILYGDLVDVNGENDLNRSLILFDENILELKQRATEKNVLLKLQLKDQEYPVLLSSLGEGVSRYIAVLCSIWASKDGYLFIDEIENGIHYTNFDIMWKIIFQASKDANCQIFATTHSKESIESFNRIQKEFVGEGNYSELFRSKKSGQLVASQRDENDLEYALIHNERVRGE